MTGRKGLLGLISICGWFGSIAVGLCSEVLKGRHGGTKLLVHDSQDRGEETAFRGTPTAACFPPQAPPSSDPQGIESPVDSFLDGVSALMIQSPLSRTSIRGQAFW